MAAPVPSADRRAPRPPRNAGTRRRDLSLALGALSVVAYNWWVAVPFRHGLMPSTDGLFSDLEATGRPDASIMSHLDLVSGVLLVAALVVASSGLHRRTRLEHGALLGFGLAGALGGAFRYSCAEGISASCRHLEWHLQLPLHHYIHVLASMAEFVLITVALHQARQRTQREQRLAARAYELLWRMLMATYVLLVAAYLTDRYGAFVEPLCFVTFSAIVMTELAEPRTEPA